MAEWLGTPVRGIHEFEPHSYNSKHRIVPGNRYVVFRTGCVPFKTLKFIQMSNIEKVKLDWIELLLLFIFFAGCQTCNHTRDTADTVEKIQQEIQRR